MMQMVFRFNANDEADILDFVNKHCAEDDCSHEGYECDLDIATRAVPHYYFTGRLVLLIVGLVLMLTLFWKRRGVRLILAYWVVQDFFNIHPMFELPIWYYNDYLKFKFMLYTVAYSTHNWYLDSLVLAIGFTWCTRVVPVYAANGDEMSFEDLFSDVSNFSILLEMLAFTTVIHCIISAYLLL